jgi:uncharacterized protein (TIGR02646 family)
MIRLERGPEPEWWWRHTTANKPRWERLFREDMRDRRPDNSVVFGTQHGELRQCLTRVQFDRCAYCETPVSPASGAGVLEHFRPRSNAEIEGAGYLPQHYFWLAFEWSNLLLACPRCNGSKRNIWPIAGSPAPIGATGQVLDREEPLLLDPFADAPEKHLVFGREGRVTARSDDRRGQATIAVLNLNREALVEARREVWSRTVELARELFEYEVSRSIIERCFPRSSPHLAVVRAAVAEVLKGRREFQDIVYKSDLFRDCDGAAYLDQQAAIVPPVTPTPPALPATRGKRYVRSIAIERFKALEDLRIDIDDEGVPTHGRAAIDEEQYALLHSAARVPALVLLGENACGKTSVLQVLALALAPHRFRYPSEDFLPANEPKASISVTLTDDETITLKLHRGRNVARRNAPKDLPILVLGSMLIVQPTHRKRPELGNPVIHELFNDSSRTKRVEQWLDDLEGERENDVRQALRIVLEEGDVLEFKHDAKGRPFHVVLHGRALRVSQLSSGYQWVVGISVELMALFYARGVDMVNGTAVAVIDEFGASLHPRWKMTALRRLREAFPGVQFILSTHDPLCLRGVYRGEVARMARDDEGIFVAQDLPSPVGLRADQLLCSDLFGLSSTVDEELDGKLEEFHRLASVSERPPEAQERYEALRTELERVGALGQTQRERIMLNVIDAYLGKLRAAQRAPLDAREQLRLSMYRRLWEIVSSNREEIGETPQ